MVDPAQATEKQLAREHTSVHQESRVRHNESLYSKLFDILNVTFLTVFILSVLYPFVNAIAISLSQTTPIKKGLVHLVPIGLNFDAYKIVFSSFNIFNAYRNSIYYSVLGTLLILVVGCLAAYPLAQRNFRARKLLTVFLTIPMFFNGGMIPLLLLIRELNMLNTVWALVLPGAFGFWFIILIRTNFQALPDGLMESARMDGAHDWHILLRIVIPLSVPILVTVALFASVGIWNSFTPALLYLQDYDKMPITIVLRDIIANSRFQFESTFIPEPLSDTGSIESMRMATILLTLGPIVLVYPFIQRYFFKGQLVGSIKG